MRVSQNSSFGHIFTLLIEFSQFSVTIAAILSAVPYLAQGIALPDAQPAIAVTNLSPAVPFVSNNLISKRADDEWLMVIYNNGKPGDQCGGVANNFNGKNSLCQGLGGVTGKVCADLKVQANMGFAQCEFNFKGDGSSCGGNVQKKVTVHKGKDSNGVKLSDDVRFVQINCS